MGRMKEIAGLPDLFGNGPGQLPVRPIVKPPEPAAITPLEGCPQEVAILYERIALELYRAGRRHFSSDAILHRIRWYHTVERGDEAFKCNNNWTAPLARWFANRHPECEEFFELRVRKSKEES